MDFKNSGVVFQAANLLKRTEGLVTLVVSNPGKKETVNNAIENTKQNAVTKPTLKASSGPPSRPSTPVPGKTIEYLLFINKNS